MHATNSNNSVEGTDLYKDVVLSYLNKSREIASKSELEQNLDIPDWYINQIAAQDTFYTSLNHNGQFVTSKHRIGRHATREGFWRVERDDETVIFHQEESTKATLKFLAFNRPAGITAAQANHLLGRPCYRALDDLACNGEVVETTVGNQRCYVHRWESIREEQLRERESELVEDIAPGDDPADDDYLYFEELLTTLSESAAAAVESISAERAAILILRQLQGDSFEAVERRLRRNQRLRDALEYVDPSDVPDSTTIWRAFDSLTGDELRQWLQEMCAELLEGADHGGEYAVIDATDVDAWANTRQEITNGDVDGASWGRHEGRFYGYKVYIIVDVAIEQPIALRMETGKTYDTTAFVPLCEDFDEHYETEELKALLADAGFDSQENREECHNILGCPLLGVINPRRSQTLKAIKQEITKIFEEHGQMISCVDDVYARLSQTTLDEYGVELGNPKDSYIYHAIKERLHRDKRAGVERVFSRLQEFTGLNRIRTQDEDNIETHLVLSAVSLVGVAHTAKQVGKSELMRSPSRII